MDCRVKPGNDGIEERVESPKGVMPGLDPGIHAVTYQLNRR